MASRDPQVLHLLRSLDLSELERFERFVASPYYNRSKRCVAVTSALAAAIRSDDPTDDAAIWTQAGFEGPVRYATLRNVYSDVLALGKRFLAVERFELRPDIHTAYTIRSLRLHRLYALAERMLAEAEADVASRTMRDDDTVELDYVLLEERSMHDTLFHPGLRREVLGTQLNRLQELYTARLLRHYLLMAHEQKISSTTLDLSFSNDLIALVDRTPELRRNAAIDVDVAALRLAAQPDQQRFHDLLALLHARQSEVPFVDAYLVHTLLVDHCMYILNVEGDEVGFDLAYRVSQSKMDAGLLTTGNVLYPDLIFVVRMAAHSGRIVEAQRILADFAPHIPDSVRDHVTDMAEGIICHLLNDHTRALLHLQRVNLSQPVLKLLVRLYTLRALMASERWDDARAAADALRHLGFPPNSITKDQEDLIAHTVRIVPRVVSAATARQNGRNGSDPFETVREAVKAMPTNTFGLRTWLEAFIAARM